MKSYIIKPSDISAWKNILKRFKDIDCCFLPEYHLAYSTREEKCEALMFVAESGSSLFCYPFLMTQIPVDDSISQEKLYDISSVYGYSGPLFSNHGTEFYNAAWNEFDSWARDHNIICEFLRFSFYHRNPHFAHPDTKISMNRINAVSYLNISLEQHEAILGSKTRNMINKASSEGIIVKHVEFRDYIKKFDEIYQELMISNNATKFFSYDDAYYNHLSKLSNDNLKLFGLFKNDEFVGGAIIVIYERYALYHLGVVSHRMEISGCSNLYLYEIWKYLKSVGISIFNLGGGRSEANDDPLLKFKMKNSNAREDFQIGTRIINREKYFSLKEKFVQNEMPIDESKLQFYG